MVGAAEKSIVPNSTGGISERRNRRKRLQLSCGECRQKKLSCDRKLPCQRCMRSGWPEQCSFEAKTRPPPASNDQSSQQQARRNSEEIRDLQAEIVLLKGLLSKVQPQYEVENGADAFRTTDRAEPSQAVFLSETFKDDQGPADITKFELSDPRERSPHGYYSQHALLHFFREIPQLFPFIKENADEHLKPLGVHLKKEKPVRNDCKPSSPFQEKGILEGLLPCKDDADFLVSFYLDHFEQLHRIIHVPTFKREYGTFWAPGRARHPTMTALVLSMLSLSAFASVSLGETSTPSTYGAMPVQWTSACDEWLRQQSSKNRKLVHYQISCLTYLAKRMNMIRKKSWWKETGALMQNAITDGLHRDPSPTIDTPYMREMKRRIWAVIRELDLQNAFDFGLPTLLHNVDSNVSAPSNIDDDFDEASKELPISKPSNTYTSASYQFHSARSSELRLEVSRRLYSPGLSAALTYEHVLQYTHALTQEIHSLPPWANDEETTDTKPPSLCNLTYAFLQFQLQQCILTIHRPCLQRDDSKYWLSETVSYQISRDILLMNSKLAGLGVQRLTLLREDLLLASLSITRLTLLQSKSSSSIIMANSTSTVELLEQCLPLMEDKYLHCFYGEPWCVLTMYAATMLLKIHVGSETWQTAKAVCAQRFLDLHYRRIGRQQTTQHQDPANQIDVSINQHFPNTAYQSAPSAMSFPASEWMDSNYPDVSIIIGMDCFGLDMELDNTWETWGSTFQD
ncbi:Transcription factor [Lachnellula occidentalis]|uniref:Transcription factor n=1 Tax=Lachnellula occidentalis TaxID=215460 RepID=A0A8H8S349_9HELO|nr:Transcription factor [Lachnellula occidentalis]